MDPLQLFLTIVAIIVGVIGALILLGFTLYSFAVLFFTINPELPERWMRQREYHRRLAEAREREQEEEEE